MKLGILDWGIGGLSVLQNIQATRPGLQGIYFSDSGSTPYGKMSESEIQKRLTAIFDYLIDRDVTHIVIACNAASTAFMDTKEYRGRPIINVISPTVEAVSTMHSKMNFKKIGVIGGDRTVESGLYLQIQDLTKMDVLQASAQPLSALIEQGKIRLEDTQADVVAIMSPLIESGIEALVLACTHYPALTPVFKALYPSLELIDPANFVSELLPISDSDRPGKMEYVTTGNSQEMQKAALKAFQHPLDPTTVSL